MANVEIELPNSSPEMKTVELGQRFSEYKNMVDNQNKNILGNKTFIDTNSKNITNNSEMINNQEKRIKSNENLIKKNQNVISQNTRDFNQEQSKNQKLFKKWEDWGNKENDVTVARTKENETNIKSNLTKLSKLMEQDYLPRKEFTSTEESIKSLSGKLNTSIGNQKLINEKQNEINTSQDNLLRQWTEWGKKNNDFNADNYVTKLDFNKSKDVLRYIPQNLNSIKSLESKNNELEQKIDSKLDESQLPKNVTIKQIQQDLNSKLSSQDLNPLSKNVNTNTININDVNKKLDQKMNKSDLLNFDAQMFREQKNNMRKVQDDLDGLEEKIQSKLDRTSLVNETTIKSLQQQLGTKLSSQDLSANIEPINKTIAILQQQIRGNIGSINNWGQQIGELRNTKDTHERTIKQIQEDLEKESQANSTVLRTNGNNIANIQRDLASKNSVISKNTQDIKKIKDNSKNISDNTSNIKRNDNAIKILTKQETNDLEKVENEINSNKEDIQFLNKTYNQEIIRLETNIKKNNDETKLNIKNIQESLNKIKTNSEDIEDVKSILPALNNSTDKVKAQAKTNSDSIEEMKQQNANVNTKLLKQTSDIRNNTYSINELKNTTLKQLQQENSKNKQLSNVKDDVEKQLRGLRSAIAFNSMNMLEMDEELQKQKLINLATMSQLARLKKNPFFNLKM